MGTLCEEPHLLTLFIFSLTFYFLTPLALSSSFLPINLLGQESTVVSLGGFW